MAVTLTLQQQLKIQLIVASLLVVVLLAVLLPRNTQAISSLLPSMLLAAFLPWIVICTLLWRGLSFHPHARLGAANALTLYRAAGTVLLASWIPAAHQLTYTSFGWLSLSAVLLLTLDGLDGYLARSTGLASSFGARFDMETDALLTLIISLLVWRSGEVGAWILCLGLMRYLFVLAGSTLKALDNPLFPSFRRKLVCVIQLASLCSILSPWLEPPWSIAVGISACLLLAASFARDTHWLLSRAS